jgi:D-ornithine---citrate ligase
VSPARPPRPGAATLAPTALSAAVAAGEASLAAVEPGLLAGFRAALPRAADAVARRLLAAMYREDLGDLGAHRPCGDGPLQLSTVDGTVALAPTVHGFARIEPVLAGDPARVLGGLADRLPGPGLRAELADAVVHLALGYARRGAADAALACWAEAGHAGDAVGLAAGLDADDQAVFFERMATEGHNLHPCGRTRLGWTLPDALAHDLEAGRTEVGFVAVRRDLHAGDDVGALLGVEAPAGYAAQPVHAWQLARVVLPRYRDLFARGALRELPDRLAGAPTAALRTLLLDPGGAGERAYLKLSLDIQVTSTRRTISVASARNGPSLSALVGRLLADDQDGGRLLLMSETAGAAVAADSVRTRDLTAIVRSGLSGRLRAGEVAVPGSALYARSPLSGRPLLAEIVDRYAGTRRLGDPPAAALAFLDEYARLLLPPVLRLATRYGIALEAHLQNCVPTFVAGVPHRLALRDFAGLRVYRPRLAARGVALALWPGSVVDTADAAVMRAKLGYTALQAHLGELVLRLVGSHGLDEPAAWRAVRAVLDEVYDGLRGEPGLAGDAADDHGFLTAARVPHKALVRMRLGGAGDVYVPVPNPLR